MLYTWYATRVYYLPNVFHIICYMGIQFAQCLPADVLQGHARCVFEMIYAARAYWVLQLMWCKDKLSSSWYAACSEVMNSYLPLDVHTHIVLLFPMGLPSLHDAGIQCFLKCLLSNSDSVLSQSLPSDMQGEYYLPNVFYLTCCKEYCLPSVFHLKCSGDCNLTCCKHIMFLK